MISLKVSLLPKGKYLLKDTNDQELKKLCSYLISQNRFDYVINYDYTNGKKPDYSLETDLQFSKLMCSNSEKNGNYITSNVEVKWNINSHSYDLMLKLVQGFFNEKKLTINNAEFEVKGLELFETLDVSELSEVS